MISVSPIQVDPLFLPLTVIAILAVNVLLAFFGGYIVEQLEVHPGKSKRKLSKSRTLGLLSLLTILILSAAVYASYNTPYQSLTPYLYTVSAIILIFDFTLKRYWLRT